MVAACVLDQERRGAELDTLIDRAAERQAEKQLVRSRSRLDEVARELAGCAFESRGPGDLWACCPFHTEDTPSFHVRPEHGLFKCFGCGESGDVFSFVQKIRGIGFREAIEFLAERSGVTLGSLSPEDRRRQTELQGLRKVLEAARDVFARALSEPAGRAAATYLAERGFTPQILQHFDVGFVPPDFMARLRRASLGEAAINGAGFTTQFARRVSFGIRDAHGALVGFGARTLEPDGKPKYVNTRETSAFNKRRLLYGLDKAARRVARSRRLVVMEGYTDVMMAHQRGVEEAVATMGTSLTEDHVRALKGRAGNMVFVFDGDAAGLDAAERAVRLTLREGVEVRVLCLPDGADPGEWFARHDADAFETLLDAEGKSTAAFLCERTLLSVDRGQPGWREQAASAVLEASRTLVDPVRREGITAEIARLCGVDRNLVREGAVAASVGQRPPATSGVRRRGPVNARVRSQFVVVAGLASRDDAAATLDELDRTEVLTHSGARRLREIALGLGTPPVDPVEWIEQVKEREPALHVALEEVLLPRPDSTLPSYDTALEHLRSTAENDHERQARRAALSRPDIDNDVAALRAIDESLRARTSPAHAMPTDTTTPTTTPTTTTGADPT